MFSASAAGLPALRIENLSSNFVLRYSPPQPFGTARLLGATNIEGLATGPSVVALQQLSSTNEISFAVTNLGGVPEHYFFVRWTDEPFNPAPGSLFWLPATQTTFGSSEADPDRQSDEGPSSVVRFHEGFFMSRFEVTQADFTSLMASNPSINLGEPNLPVDNVSWDEADTYCIRLTETERAAGRLPEGWVYRLPTEMEWEYAARHGASTRFFFGDDPDYQGIPEYAWIFANSESRSHPIGQKKPSLLGLHDIHGNVAEWTADWYGPYIGGQVYSSTGPRTGEYRVIRGGSYLDEAAECRATYRHYDWTTNRFADVGFRTVLARANPQPIDKAPELVLIKAGQFKMGTADPEEIFSDEWPVSEVTLLNDFYIGKFEVSQREYLSLMSTNPSRFNSGQLDRPVENVSWSNAVVFCQLLTDRERARGTLPEGHEYRLPTEAEWEYVARAGSELPFFFGDNPAELDDYAWHFTAGMTYGVGGKKPNPWGVYDIYGNVFEWCQDWYGEYAGGVAVHPLGPDTQTSIPRFGQPYVRGGPEATIYRLMRGGSYLEEPDFCRSAFRMYADPTNRLCNVGFRVVLALTASIPPRQIELVKVEPQSFRMGSLPSDPDREPDEGPVEVQLTYSFWAGRFEVTQDQYTSLVQTNPSTWRGPSHRPVEKVSWSDATNFCALLTERERAAGTLSADHEYRLPTEAEWECIARLGSTNRFTFGDDFGFELLDLYSWNMVAPTRGIGGKEASAGGFHDLYGNVSEWCLDWYGPYADTTRINPRGPAASDVHWRVIRGGSIEEAPPYCRPAFRGADWPDAKSQGLGFRVVLAPIDIAAPPKQITLVRIEPGQFVMGAGDSETGASTNERPARLVSLTQAFWIGATEVTQSQFSEIMETNVSFFQGYRDEPVENVTWIQATNFCAKLTQRELEAGRLPSGHLYRLPTEAEWEYACRAGSTNKYSFGNDPALLGDYAWHALNADARHHVVGARATNAFALYDMHGNVAEWCHDWFALYPSGDSVDPTGPASGTARVVRGGGFNNTAPKLRSAARSLWDPAKPSYLVGFRVVLAPPTIE